LLQSFKPYAGTNETRVFLLPAGPSCCCRTRASRELLAKDNRTGE
jgi:hypothetical protein